MNCRCEEITRVENLISQINEADDILRLYHSVVSDLTAEISALADSLNLAVTPEFAAPAGQKMREIPGRFSQAGERIGAKLTFRRAELASQREELQTEDKGYHLWKERQERELKAKKKGREYLERL